jgi:outer membrane protein
MLKKIFFILFILPFSVSAQNDERISYREMVELALKNNYDIQVAKNNLTISAIQNNYGYAGFLPKLDLVASGNIANNNTRQEFSSGAGVDRNNVSSNNLATGAYLSWTIFDGFKMFATKERLNLLEQQGELSFKIQLENTIENVTLLYYQIVKQNQLIKGIQASMAVSDERIKIAETRIKVGSGSNVELLQAKLDLNAQKSSLITQRNNLNEYKTQLMVLAKAESSLRFSVDTSFVFDDVLSMDIIKEKIDKENNSVLFSRKNTLVSKQNIKIIKSQTLPTVSFNSNYLFGRSENGAGLILLNRNLGFNVGVSATWNLFNGSFTRTQLSVAGIQLENSFLNETYTKLNLLSNADIAFIRWQGDKELVDLEEENIRLADQSLFIISERLKLGLGNYLEIKESQNSYEEAVTRLVNARYNMKVSETTLKKLTGELVK